VSKHNDPTPEITTSRVNRPLSRVSNLNNFPIRVADVDEIKSIAEATLLALGEQLIIVPLGKDHSSSNENAT
jgi:hypothetical protein